MSKHVIALYYEGLNPTESFIASLANNISVACSTELQPVVVKHYDEDAIIKAVGNDAIRKIVFDKENEKQQEVGMVKICFNSGPNKLQVVKLIKETFHMPLKDAKDAVDNGIVTVPLTTNDYQFVRDLCACGGCIADGGDERYAVAQAAVFINGKYPGSMQAENLVKDFAMARYHDSVNAADDIEKALLNTVRIVKERPHIAQQWINSDLVKTITML